jgi:hypothetical protein
VEGVLVPGLNDEELAAFRRSAEVLRDTAGAAGL